MTESAASAQSVQAAIGVTLSAVLIVAWTCLHLWSIFFLPLNGAGVVAAPIVILAICWLDVGLFIVAHDAMHGSLAPARPRLNRIIGRVALFLYAGFSFDRLLPKHFAHHRAPGGAEDPDFSVRHPRAFWPWYREFLQQYLGLRELAVIAGLVAAYVLLLGAGPLRLLSFWALPAVLSSMQLFLFGTFLPHREAEAPFGDRHRARSNEYGWLVSLLTCFHFGYHHEHHDAPHVPWWKLPSHRRAAAAACKERSRPSRA